MGSSKKHTHLITLILSVVAIGIVLAGQDFYELLGVSKGASSKEIRKAFKKLAQTEHPDKKTDDPEAHDKFIRINRAYEVLKDEDLRKKYDQHGEEGLEDNFQRGRQYESWQWYQQNFGIYDDDQEIITLSRMEFEQLVEGTEEPWFINFYSPHCSHCHELAPTWRELAKELEGVIRIGAVNCEDEWQLCRMQGIRSYPSLMFYPQREKYYGDRTTTVMVDHALKNVKAIHHELWSGNFRTLVQENEDDLPWLITFCGDGGDCLEKKTCLKLASMLADLVNVGLIDCHAEPTLCEEMDRDYGTYFYTKDQIRPQHGLEITSLEAKDIARTVMQQLPDVEMLDKDVIMDLMDQKQDRADTWLIHFIQGNKDDQDIELRKLPALLKDYKIGRVDCSQMASTCNELHITKLPSFAILKEMGGMEMYYGGRTSASDLAAFVQDSADIPLESLTPADFPDRVVLSPDPWFVDFFAPWCPPCMRLLPEFKKAARDFGTKVNFGTVDCTVHSSLCNTYNIRSYPTTIFYNHSTPHQYHGHHSANHIVEFIEDTLNPPVIILTESTFTQLVGQRKNGDLWLVDFFAPWCGPCQQLAPEWRRLAKMLKDKPNVHVGQVDCTEHTSLCHSQGVHSYPTMRLYPIGYSGTSYHRGYNGWHRDATSLHAWVYEHLPSRVVTLTYQSFISEVLPSREPWIVDFYAPWCGHCQVFKPEFERVAELLDGKARAGKVDCDSHPQVCHQAGIHAYPSVRFYQGSRSGVKQSYYGMDIESQNVQEIVRFVERYIPKGENKANRRDEL